jgi:glycosyltransferase involved in cell wall biosynthesis
MVKDEGLQSIVIFAGYQKDVSKILPVFDVFCLPSFSEGLPVSVLEAMAAEIPVIGSLAKGISEIIQDRHTGLLFNIDSDLELAGLIKDLIASTSLRQEIAYKGHKYVEDNHNIETWVNSYSRLFNVVMLKNIQ